MTDVSIIDTTMDNVLDLGVCGYKNIKREGFPEKLDWLKARFSEGLKIKSLYSEKDGVQGMIEYLPGQYCWRPVTADGYMFIHCIMVGFKRAYKNQGYGSSLVAECEKDARKGKFKGVAVVTRKGSFMVGRELFLKNGYEAVDAAPPDFELLVKKFNKKSPSPKFKGDWGKRLKKYQNGLFIVRSDQCPYTVKNVREICETAREAFGLEPKVIDLKNRREAQNSPCPFGTFCIIHNGELIAEHPISKGRFTNIMKKLMP